MNEPTERRLSASGNFVGYPGYELKPQGSEIDVTANNLHEYVEAVVEATLRSGIRAQIEAFRSVIEEYSSVSNVLGTSKQDK